MQKRFVLSDVENRRFDLQVEFAGDELPAHPHQLIRPDRIETDLVEETQQPRLARFKFRSDAKPVPHLYGAPDELVAAGPFHAVDAHVGAADPDRVFRRPGAGRIVFGRHEAAARIERGRDRRAEVDIAESHHQIAGVEYSLIHFVNRVQPVDAADEFDVVRTAPRRTGADRADVFFNGEPGGGIVP